MREDLVVCNKEMFDFRECFILLLTANSPHYVIRTGRCSISFISPALKNIGEIVFTNYLRGNEKFVSSLLQSVTRFIKQ